MQLYSDQILWPDESTPLIDKT